MVTLTIRNVPEKLHQLLKQSAKRHRRGINSEVIACLEKTLGPPRVDAEKFLERARALRKSRPDLFITDKELRTAKKWGRP